MDLVWSIAAAIGPLCWVDVVSDRPLNLEHDSVGLGGETKEGRGAQSALTPLSSSVLSIPSASPLSFL